MSGRPTNQRSFHLHSCLGRGGFGEVYHATMHQPGGLSTDVALKLLRSDASLNDEALTRLQDEGHLLSQLKHPSILQVYDLTHLDGRVGLITEYIPGEDFHHALRDEDHPLPARATLEVVARVAAALDAAYHAAQSRQQALHLVHRDIKPSNVRIGLHGEVKLLDFGVAHSLDPDRQALTKTNTALGSLPYMSPERFQRGEPTPATDIYALGCCLFEGLTGARLHEDPVPVEMFALAAVAADHDAQILKRLNTLADEVDDEVRALLVRMLDHDPAARPSAHEVSELCDGLAAGRGGATLRTWMRGHTCLPPQQLPKALQGRRFFESEDDDPSASPTTTTAEATDAITLTHNPPPRATHRRYRVGIAAVMGVILAGIGVLWLQRADQAPPAEQTAALPGEVRIAPALPQPTYVDLSGNVGVVELRAVDGSIHSLPGWLQPGAYDVYANFGAMKRWVRKVNVSGKRRMIQCDMASYACRIEP